MAIAGNVGASKTSWIDKLDRVGEPVEAKLSNKEFRRLHANSDEKIKFQHGKELLTALKTGKTEFEVLESLTAESPEFQQWNLADFDDSKTRGFYQSRTKYALHKDHTYIIQSDEIGSALKKTSATSMEYCGSSTSLKEKTIIVSLEEGSHLITSAKPSGNCVHLETEQMHPWELFSSMNIQAFVERPFHTSYNQEDRPARKLGANDDIAPDPPLKSCKTYPTDLFLEKDNWIRMGRQQGCAYAIGMMPGSVAANYNWNTKSAANPVLLGPLTCDNCFLVMGTGLLAAVNYVAVPGQLAFASFYAELKMVGAAGASLGLKGSPGEWSASKTMNLQNLIPGVAPNGVFSIGIGGTGLKLKFSFAGATALMRGTGTSQGSFSVGYGRLGSVNLGGIYDKSKGFSAIKDVNWQNLDKPFTNNGFTVTNWQASVELKAGMNIAISFVSIITGNFNIFIGGTASISSPAGTTGKLSAAKLQNSASRRRLSSGVMTVQPGDVLEIEHAFENFNPDEQHSMYYSLKSLATGVEYPILTQQFSTGETGEGTVSARYTVPWNLNMAAAGQSARLAGSLGSIKDLLDGSSETLVPADASAVDTVLGPDTGKLVLIARTSAYMDVSSAVTTSDPLVVDMFSGSDNDGIFSYPGANAVLGVTKPITVTWNSALLHEFRNGPHTYTGDNVDTANVGIELVAETLNADGTVLFSQRHYVARNLPNNGAATLSLNPFTEPFSIAPSGSARYYLLVSSESDYQVQGWSKGYFRFDSAGHEQASASASASPMPRGTVTMLSAAQPMPFDPRVLAGAKRIVSGVDPKESMSRGASLDLMTAPASQRALQSKAAKAGKGAASGAVAEAGTTSLILPVACSIFMGAGILSVDLIVFGSFTFNRQFQTTLWSQTYQLKIAGTAAPPGTPCGSLSALSRHLEQLAAPDAEEHRSSTFRQLQRAARRGAARAAKPAVGAAAGAVCAWKPKPAPNCAQLHDWIDASLADAEGETSFVRGLKARARGIARNSVTAGAQALGQGASCPLKPAPGATPDCSKMRGPARTKCLAAAKPKTPGAAPDCSKLRGSARTKCLAAAKPKPAPGAAPDCSKLRGPARTKCLAAAKPKASVRPSTCQAIHEWLDRNLAVDEDEVEPSADESVWRWLQARGRAAGKQLRSTARTVGKSAVTAGARAVGAGASCRLPVMNRGSGAGNGRMNVANNRRPGSLRNGGAAGARRGRRSPPN